MAVEKTWLFEVGMVVLLNEWGKDTAFGLDTQGEGGNVEEENILTSPDSTPPWMAAPMATTSSG